MWMELRIVNLKAGMDDYVEKSEIDYRFYSAKMIFVIMGYSEDGSTTFGMAIIRKDVV